MITIIKAKREKHLASGVRSTADLFFFLSVSLRQTATFFSLAVDYNMHNCLLKTTTTTKETAIDG